MTQKDEIYLIDGSGYIFRAYYALAYSGAGAMTNPQGVPIGAVYGFTSMLLKLVRKHPHAAIAVIFDAGRETFRNDLYPAYKANRDETPEDLIPQFPIVRAAAQAFGFPVIEQSGFEADDLIATYACQANQKGLKVKIVSSDKDLMQLVNENIVIYDPMKDKIIDRAGVIEKFGVPPEKVCDVQALIGDTSDNIPGVPGIGVKTAAQLITEYGTLAGLLSRANEIKQVKRRETILAHQDKAELSYRLVTLVTDAPVPIPLEQIIKHDPALPDLKSFMEQQGFKSLLSRLPDQRTPTPVESAKQVIVNDAPPIEDNCYTLINDLETLKAWIDGARTAGALAIDTETTDLTPAKATLVGISLSYQIGQAAYIPLGHRRKAVDLLDDHNLDEITQLSVQDVVETIKPLLEDRSVLKIGQNIKYDWQILERHGITMAPCADTMLLSYTLDGTSQSNSMDALSARLLNHTPIKFEEVAGKGKHQVTFDLVDIEKAKDYAAEDADVTLRLYHALYPRLAHEKMCAVYEDIERPLIPVIAQMELNGIKADPLRLKAMSAEFATQLSVLEKKIHQAAGTDFNIASPKQIGEILFDQMGLQGGKKTKTGQWATDVAMLEKLAGHGYDIIDDILSWRGLSKLKSTYTDALQDQINSRTGRVHTSFSMAGTSTGRLASSDPNLQNIPIRTEEGRKIREAFIAEDGCVLLSVDYSQVELRLCAEMANVAALKQAFRDGVDIHALTASQVFGVPLDQIDGDLRRKAKAVNFGIIYGISGWGLAKQLDCEPSEAHEFIRKYLDTFHEIETFMDNQKNFARAHGYVKTLFGRKCYTPNINVKQQNIRMGAERAAINAPLQGTAADIMKLAMVKMPDALKKAGLFAKMLLQVHDELIFEVPEAERDDTAALVKSVMESVVTLDVPLVADVGFGSSWATAH